MGWTVLIAIAICCVLGLTFEQSDSHQSKHRLEDTGAAEDYIRGAFVISFLYAVVVGIIWVLLHF